MKIKSIKLPAQGHQRRRMKLNRQNKIIKKMKKSSFVILSLFVAVLINSCKKENAPDVNWQGIQRCNDALNLDSTGVANRLIGQWQLKSWYCGMCSDPGTHQPDKTVVITFTSAGQYTVTENSTVESQGNWDIGRVGTNNWGLQSISSSRYLAGYILFCDKQVMFTNGYLDGTDNLFFRLN